MPTATTTQSRRKARQANEAAIREIDAEIAAIRRDANERVAALTATRDQLHETVRRLGGTTPAQRRRSRSRKQQPSSRDIAGPAAMEAVSAYMQEHGRAYQADVVEDTGLNSGTVSHALRALATEEQPPKVRLTGEERRGSKEFDWIGPPAANTVTEDEGQGRPEPVTA